MKFKGFWRTFFCNFRAKQDDPDVVLDVLGGWDEQTVANVNVPSSSEATFSLDHLPEDILVEICTAVAYLDSEYTSDELLTYPLTSTSRTLRNLCLVSKRLLHPAQSTLYRAVAFRRIKQCQRFLRTVERRPELAKHVLVAQIGVLEDQDGDAYAAKLDSRRRLTGLMLDGLERCTSCQHLRIYPLTQPVGMRVLDIIPRLPLRSLALRVYDAHAHLTRQDCVFIYQTFYEVVFSHPTLRTMEQNFRPSIIPSAHDIAPVRTYTSHIVSFHTAVNVPRFFFNVLAMMVDTLEVLSVYTSLPLDAALARPAFAALVNLRTLRFESIVAESVPNAAQANFWLQDVIYDYPHLSRLSVTHQDVLPTFFMTPPSFEVVEFITLAPNPEEQLRSFAAIARTADAVFCTSTCIFITDAEAFGRHVRAKEIKDVIEAFERKGITFEVKFEIGDFLVKEVVAF